MKNFVGSILAFIFCFIHSAYGFEQKINCELKSKDSRGAFEILIESNNDKTATLKMTSDGLEPFQVTTSLDGIERRGMFLVLYSGKSSTFLYFPTSQHELINGDYPEVWFSGTYSDPAAPKDSVRYVPGAVLGEGSRFINQFLACRVR